MNSAEKIKEALIYLHETIPVFPDTAIILGSGLGPFVDTVETLSCISTAAIPHYPQSTVSGHKGNLLLASVNGNKLLIAQGRIHYYEGYTPGQIVFPVALFARLGIKKLLITCAAGGITPHFAPGDFMLISDHINVALLNPLIGPFQERSGTRFPDMSGVYDRYFLDLAHELGSRTGIALREGVLAWMPGPQYETNAEITMLRKMGADAVSMSTVPEVITAAQQRIRVLAIAVITNKTISAEKRLSHEEVLETASKVQPVFVRLLISILPHLCTERVAGEVTM